MRHGAPPLRHARILASAGSGKTFRLSGRAIELLLRGVAPPTLLASTFTRAAAAEIRDRVLGRLARAVLDDHARADLAIGSGLGEPTREEVVTALERTVDAIDRLQLRTLDSLFASTVLACAAELGMPSEVRIVDEPERERLEDEAIAAMLAESDAPALLATIAAINKGRERLTVAGAIRSAVTPVLAIARQSGDEAWLWPIPRLADADDVAGMIADHQALPPQKQKQMQTAIERDRVALAVIGAHDARAWQEFLESGIAKKVLAGDATFYRAEIPGDVLAAYEPLVGHATDLAAHAAARHTVALRELAVRFDARFAEAKRRAGGVTFDDLTMALAKAAELPDLAEIFFRLDTRIGHALLDEFQDTSVPQWRALRPLLREIAGGDPAERSLFVVGDLKQSIYGWRGASPALLGSLPSIALESGTLAMDDERLATSFRSSQIVLDAVNEVFDGLSRNPVIVDADPTLRHAAEGWLLGWQRHDASDPSRGGVAELHIAPRVGGHPRSSEQQGAVLDAAVALVGEILRDAPHGSIGVLCRRNRSVAGALNRLRDRGIPASARGAGSLCDAAAVNAMIAALDLADHPNDTIAAFHVAHSPLGPIVGVHEHDHLDGRRLSRHRVSRRLRATLERDGYATTLAEWRERLTDPSEPLVDEREAKRLDQLVEAVATCDDAARANAIARRPGDVARMLRALVIDESGGGGVTVMNIHQSKGLEFDAVVLCDIDQSFRLSAPIAAVRSPTRPDSDYLRVTRVVAKAVQQGEVAEVIAAATEDAYREFLSMLYVAVTRARRGLFVVTAPASASGSLPNSFGGLLRGAWCPSEAAAGCAYRSGDRGALAGSAPKERATPAPEVRLPAIETSKASGLRVTRALSASAREVWEAPTDLDADAVLRIEAARRRAKERGTLAHAMLESIEWMEVGEVPSVERLRAAALRAYPRADVAALDEAAELVGAALAKPSLRSWFERSGPSGPTGDWLRSLVGPNARPIGVRREWRYARLAPTEGGGGALEQGSIDRLVLYGGGDSDGPAERPIAALIVDFKSDRATAGAASSGGTVTNGGTLGPATDPEATLRGRYAPQLAAYREAVCERFRLPASAVGAVIIALDGGHAVPVPFGS
jgi:ATP-dependent helicase/nuclease subunit A